jgi:hypothetical protein
MYLRTCGSSTKKPGSANRKFTNKNSVNHQNNWVRKSHIRKVPHFGEGPKSNKFFKFSILRICNLRNLFAELICGPPIFACLCTTATSLIFVSLTVSMRTERDSFLFPSYKIRFVYKNVRFM